MNIPLGFEVGSGRPVSVPAKHLCVTGQTQESGKTTTLEALITRSGFRAVAFITKRGERSFRLSRPIPAFYRESSTGEYWEYVRAIVEGMLEVKLGYQENGMLIKLCQDYERAAPASSKKKDPVYKWKGAKSLKDLQRNLAIARPHQRGNAEVVAMQLGAYLEKIIPEIEHTDFAGRLELQAGVPNVMDISGLSTTLQSLVIRATIEWVHQHGKKTVVIIPEAWKFIPRKTTPVKQAVERLIREGAALQNFVWLDSQDLRGVDPLLLRSIGVWIFGVQRERNEVANTLDTIPDLPKPLAGDIMRLQKGQFFVAYGSVCIKTYVQPAGMGAEHAKAIAKGEEDASSWKQIVQELDAEEEQNKESHAENRQDDAESSDSDDVSASAVESSRHDLGQTESEGDEMWKERAEKAEAELAEVKARLRAMEAGNGSLPENGTKTAAAATPNTPAAAPVPFAGKGRECVDIYPELRRMILADQAVLAKLAVLQPQLDVTVERRTVEMSDGTLKGSIAKMLHRGFFKSPKQSVDVRRELIRVGAADDRLSNANLSNALKALNEYGFLTAEAEGWLEVPGMKVNILEK